MNLVFKHLNNNKAIYTIIFLFLFAKLVTLGNYKIVWWDSAVYIGMGKSIYSLGDSGLWEETRPLVWPLMLGFLWKIGLNPVFYGKALELAFGSLCIFLTYFIGKKLFGGKTASLASLFLALSPTFFFFNGIMLTEIVSTAFTLLAIYYLTEKKHFICGLFFGIAFLTRFLQLFAFIAVLAAAFIFGKAHFKILKKILTGFIMAITPYFIINQILYGNLFYPFISQFFLAMGSGWHNYHPFSFYFIGLLRENFLYSLSFLGLFLAFRLKDINKKHLAVIFAVFFVFFNLIKQKEMRFLIILLPYMCLLASFSIFYFYNKLKSNAAREILAVIIILSFVFSIAAIIQYYKSEAGKANQYEYLQDKFRELDANGVIWASNPIMFAVSDKKIAKLMYYPIFNREKKEELIMEMENSQMGMPDFVLIDSCDLECRPNDKACVDGKNELLNSLKQQLKIAYHSMIWDCEQMLLKKG